MTPCCNIPNKITKVVLIHSGKARNNFFRHVKNKDAVAINKQIKRGSVRVVPV
jgi:hypothetical protein